MSDVETRSMKRILIQDLRQLLRLAFTERKRFFEANPRYKASKNSLLCIALCQGAAKHYVDHKNGVKDFDIWYFYTRSRSKSHLSRLGRYGIVRDSKMKKFGKNTDYPQFIGRKVDLMIRELDAKLVDACGGDARACISAYLYAGKTQSARELAKKAVVGLYPEKTFGQILWATK